MKVTISLDFDDLKQEIKDAFAGRLDDLGYTEEQITALEKSFDENIVGGFMDATFQIVMNDDETEVAGCVLVGG